MSKVWFSFAQKPLRVAFKKRKSEQNITAFYTCARAATITAD